MSQNSIPVFTEQIDIEQIAGDAKVFVLVDGNTARYCLPLVKLPQNAVVIEIQAGEEHKTINACIHIWQHLTIHNAERGAVLINLGGGLVCDIGGFAAACYKRGIKFIHVPTSLLAMTDAAIGGKTGIDFMGYKNQIGVFANPQRILINPAFLKTLPKRQLISGMAEVVKHYIIADEDSFNALVKHQTPDIENYADWKAIIEKAIHIKSTIVKEDPFEKGVRKILNFGHTVGHAIESFYMNSDKPLLHGEAVAAGMICELLMAKELKLISASDAEKAISFLLHYFAPFNLVSDIDAIIILMKQDKKIGNSKLAFSLPNRIGHCLYNCEVPDEIIRKSILKFNEHITA